MSHQTVCPECVDKRGRTPKRWEWNCDECATWHANKHRQETGHQVELRITVERTAQELIHDMRTARLTQRRVGW